MKVRIQGNSIRLRLKQEEVAALALDATVDMRMEFGPDAVSQHFVYRLETTEASDIHVTYQGHCVCIQLPIAQAKGWDTSSEVGFECDVPLAGGSTMHVLIEKDFKCLDMRPDEGDCFPNPNISC